MKTYIFKYILSDSCNSDPYDLAETQKIAITEKNFENARNELIHRFHNTLVGFEFKETYNT